MTTQQKKRIPFNIYRGLLLVSLLMTINAGSSYSQNDILIPYRNGTQWGFADTTGQVIITPAYEAVKPFDQGYAQTRQKGKWGMIDEQGKLLVEPLFTHVAPFGTLGFTVGGPDHKEGLYIPGKGVVIEPGTYFQLGPLGSDPKLVKVLVLRTAKLGLLKLRDDFSGVEKMLLPVQYESITESVKGDQLEIEVMLPTGETQVMLLDKDYRLSAPELKASKDEPEFVDMMIDGMEPSTVVPQQEKTQTQQADKPILHRHILELKKVRDQEGRAKLVSVDRLYQPQANELPQVDTLDIDFDEVTVLPLPYPVKLPVVEASHKEKSAANYLQSDWAILRRKDKKAIVNAFGELLTEWTYNEILPYFLPRKDQAPWFMVEKDKKWGVIDLENKVILGFIYDEIRSIRYHAGAKLLRFYESGDPLITRMGEYYGLINERGETILAHELDQILWKPKNSADYSFHLFKDGLHGLYYKDGYIPPIFDQKVDDIVKFNNYPVCRIVDELVKLLGYGDRKGFYYFEN